MIYSYRCENCQKSYTVTKSYKFIDQIETCELCSTVMSREICLPTIQRSSAKPFNPYHCNALGIDVNSKGDIKDQIKKLNYEQGRTIVEMGNDDHPENMAPVREAY